MKVRIADRQVERERAQWSEIQEFLYSAATLGYGEYLMEEPLYFGQAFAEKPHFTFSASWANEIATGANIRANGWPHPDHKGYQYYPPLNGALPDGGFDWQGYFIPNIARQYHPTMPLIPKLGEVNYWRWGVIPYLYFSTLWAQTDASTLWTIIDDDVAPGRGSHYSAKYVFGSDATSNWLTPVRDYLNGEDEDPGSVPALGITPYESRFFWRSGPGAWVNFFPIATRRAVWPHNYIYSSLNPPLDAYWFRYSIKSDGPINVRFHVARFWAVWETDEFAMFDGDLTEAEVRQNVYAPSTNWGFQRICRDSVHFHPGGYWEDVEFNLEETWRFIPDSPSWGFAVPLLFMIRLEGGSPGQQVWLDDVQYSLDYTDVSAPSQITVGVAEWIVDNQKAYIGARLWFKIGESSRDNQPGLMETFDPLDSFWSTLS